MKVKVRRRQRPAALLTGRLLMKRKEGPGDRDGPALTARVS